MLTNQQVRTFYDRFGRKQDWQRIYEGEAIRDLLAHGGFEEASVVFEFGCGTGAFAAHLLAHRLPAQTVYLGCDLSPTMVGLTQARLAQFGRRATVQLTDGTVTLNLADATCDCFVSNYVFDLLPEEAIERLLVEAHRVLRPGGRLCLISLSYGTGPFSRLLVSAWQQLHAWRPMLVGGCRPLTLRRFIDPESWSIKHYNLITSFGLPSEILVAQRRR